MEIRVGTSLCLSFESVAPTSLMSEGLVDGQVLELEDATANLSVIHVAGTKGKVRPVKHEG